jgi:hypothetical protein
LFSKQNKNKEKAKNRSFVSNRNLSFRANSLFLSIHYRNDHCYLFIPTEAQEEEAARQREVQKPKAKSKKENRKQEED